MLICSQIGLTLTCPKTLHKQARGTPITDVFLFMLLTPDPLRWGFELRILLCSHKKVLNGFKKKTFKSFNGPMAYMSICVNKRNKEPARLASLTLRITFVKVLKTGFECGPKTARLIAVPDRRHLWQLGGTPQRPICSPAAALIPPAARGGVTAGNRPRWAHSTASDGRRPRVDVDDRQNLQRRHVGVVQSCRGR